jgi:excisionase family DNA binding protein
MTKSETPRTGSALLSFKEAARRLSCSEAALRKWKFQGRIPFVRIGRLVRMRDSDVDDLAAHGLPGLQNTSKRVSPRLQLNR